MAANPNPFNSPVVTARAAGSLISAEQQRAIAQVQASMLIARSMPRDRRLALDLILQDCTDIELAEEAEYEYSRGGTKISGPSIRLLETVARRWGNLETGIEEISRHDGYSEFRAYAMDLETGWRDTKVFQVKHWRDTKSGGHALTDERDIYELGANMGARRKRACMEAVMPADVIRQAAVQCQVTLQTKVEVTAELIASLVENFAKFNVTREMIEKRIQRHLTAITPGLVVQMRRIYNSLKDGMAQPSDFFETVVTEPEAGKGSGAALKAAVARATAPKTAPVDAPPDVAAPPQTGVVDLSEDDPFGAITDEAKALLAIERAKDEGEASAVIERCKGQPFRPRIVAEFNKRFKTEV